MTLEEIMRSCFNSLDGRDGQELAMRRLYDKLVDKQLHREFTTDLKERYI